jgi:glycosyltransferase involved in cell wall biosynthesis
MPIPTSKRRPLVIVETHPVQYRAPVYRSVEKRHGIPVEVIYGSDFSVAGYYDKEFRTSFAWDVDLIGGSACRFLSRVAQGGAASVDAVSAEGLGQELRKTGAGAVLLTGYQPSFHLSAFYQAWRSGYPILFRAETTDHAQTRNCFKVQLRDRGLRQLYSLCKRVLPIGSRSYDHYRRLGVRADKMVLSPYCVDTTPFQCGERDRDEFRTSFRRDLRIPDNHIAVLFSGKLSVRKGVHVLVDAVKSMPPQLRDKVVLLFLGDGSERGALSERCSAAPGIRTEFIGFRNQSQMSPYYHAADLMTLPSIVAETWGLVVNEALHHGLPCVVTDAVGCAPDLIESGVTGEVAAAGSSESLSAALCRAAEYPKNEDRRNSCRTKVSRFTVETAADGIAAAYQTVAGSAGTVR